MASKVLVPTAPFARLQVKKSPSETGSGFVISSDPAARVVHLEHSVRFLQEQHRLMLSGLHAEIEALRERNRDLQFQLIFNKDSSPKPTASISNDDSTENKEITNLKREVCRLEREAGAARGEARAAEARALQLQRLVDAQAEKLRQLELSAAGSACAGSAVSAAGGAQEAASAESRAELRARLAEAERLVRRLRADAERQRREVLAAPPGGAVTNLLFDGAAASHAHLQCMKNSLHASLRASGLDGSYAYQGYHFPSLHAPDFWRDPLRDDYSMSGGRGRSTRRPLVLPELAAHQMHRPTVYANNHTRARPNGYENKTKKIQPPGADASIVKPPEDAQDSSFRWPESLKVKPRCRPNSLATYPELKIVVTKVIPHGNVTSCAGDGSARARPRRAHHRKLPGDNT